MTSSSTLMIGVGLLLLTVACCAQMPGPCGITSIGGNYYNFSKIGAVSVGINPSGLNWGYTVCDASAYCAPQGSTAYTACTGQARSVPLALVGDPIQWSFVDAQRPQLGVLAQYPLTQDPVLTSLFRQLTVLFACGPATVHPGQSGPGLAALQGSGRASGTATVIQYTFTVTTSVVCSFTGKNLLSNDSQVASM